MPVLDQVGRAFVQFDIIFALISTPIYLVLSAFGVPLPGPIAAGFLSPKAFKAIESTGPALAAMLVFGYSIYVFVLDLFKGIAGVIAAIGLAAASAFGAPSISAAAAAFGALAQGLADFYLLVWLLNMMSQSPFFNAIP